jgi:cytochrome c-type biogenesis protein CcmH
MKRLLLILLLAASPVFAVEPDEMLDDPALETRARELSQGLRCPVCRNESIDESNADIAKDIRILLRERLVAGDSDEEAVQFLVDRYGEYVLLAPTAQGANLVLYLAGPVLLLLGAGVAVVYLRRRRTDRDATDTLSTDEKARLDELMRP